MVFEDRIDKATDFVSIVKDKEFKHIVRIGPDFLSPIIGKVPSGIALSVQNDIVNMYGWWLKISSDNLLKYDIISEQCYILAQAPGYPPYFERQIALAYKSLLPIDVLHIIREKPSEKSNEIGKISGQTQLLGMALTKNVEGEWLHLFGTDIGVKEGWTLICNNTQKFLEKVQQICE